MAITLTTRYEEKLARENLLLWVGEGETYDSKLSEPYVVFVTPFGNGSAISGYDVWDEYVEGYINTTISGTVITFQTNMGGGSAHNGNGGTCSVTILGRA